MPIGM